MAVILRGEAVQISLEEYFEKYGFGDGDDGAINNVAYAHRDLAMRLIREEAQHLGLRIHIQEYDGGSIHNNCRISLFNGPSQSDFEISIDEGKVTDSDLSPSSARRLERAIALASRRFDVEVLKPEGSFQARRVGDRPPKPRHVTARQGATLLKRLAKEDREHAETFTQIAALLTAQPR